jgi:hypothetical protein
VLIASIVLAVTLAPAMQALYSGLRSGEVHGRQIELQDRAANMMAELLGTPFDQLDAEAQSVGNPTVATAFSDAGGTPDRRLVYLSRFDGDNADADGNSFTGTDDGLLWLRVSIEDTVIETYTLRRRP